MNYEQLYAKLQSLEKELADGLGNIKKLQGSLGKNSSIGDIKAAIKSIATISNNIDKLKETATVYQDTITGFDINQYVTSGEYAQDLISDAQSKNVDITGEGSVYDLFPYRVRISDSAIEINKKNYQYWRPASVINFVKLSQDKQSKSNFNATGFLNELVTAYDRYFAEKNYPTSQKVNTYAVMLKTIYEYLTPMARLKKDYDIFAFAYDLSRLYENKDVKTKDGRSFYFGSAKDSKPIRILDKLGKEILLSTIDFKLDKEN
jgi:hypothetical protein